MSKNLLFSYVSYKGGKLGILEGAGGGRCVCVSLLRDIYERIHETP